MFAIQQQKEKTILLLTKWNKNLQKTALGENKENKSILIIVNSLDNILELMGYFYSHEYIYTVQIVTNKSFSS